MNARSAFGGMKAEACSGLGMVGDLGAVIGVNRCIGFARSHNLNATRRQQRAKPNAERQGEGLLRLTVGHTPAQVVAAMRGIQNNDEAGLRGRWSLCRSQLPGSREGQNRQGYSRAR